jgi:hypothetical protein
MNYARASPAPASLAGNTPVSLSAATFKYVSARAWVGFKWLAPSALPTGVFLDQCYRI